MLTNLTNLLQVFSSDRHPHSLGPCPDDPLDAGDEWTPFDFTMSRFLHGTGEQLGRTALAHIAHLHPDYQSCQGVCTQDV